MKKNDTHFAFSPWKITVTILFLLSHTKYSSAQWVQTNGPEGITINVFYDYGSYLFAGSDAKGVFRSADNGVHWEPANEELENSAIFSFTSGSDYLYAGTWTGVYRSSDNGLNWEAANSGISQQFVNELVTGDGYLFAGTIGSGVFRSPDQGASWQDANGGALGSSFIKAMCYVGDRLIVEADNYIFYSTDFGDSWFIDQGSTAFYPIENFGVQGDTIYASAYGGVFHSYNGGVTWSNFLTVNPDFDILGFAFSNDTVFVGCQNGMYFSVNSGLDWTVVPATGLRFGNRFYHHFAKSGSNYLLGMDELGVYLTTDKGSTWGQYNKGFPPASTIDNSMITIGNELWTGTHSNGVHKSPDNGELWNKTGTTNDNDSLSNGIIFSLLNPEPNIILSGACGYGLYRSSDNGTSWTHITDGLPFEANNYECDKALAKVGGNLLVGTFEGLYYSTDLGLTWLPSNLTGDFYSVEAIAVNGDVAVASLSSFNAPSGIYRSTNNGVSWTQVAGIFDIVSMASDGGDHFYAGTLNSGNFVSSDNGVNWQSVGGGIPGGAGGFTIKAIGQHVFIGNNLGLFHSDNYGASFTDASEGLDPEPNNAVQGLAANDQYLFAGLFRDAVWRRPLADFGIVATAVAENSKADRLVLYQNSPNPFRNATIIQYALPNERKVSFSVTDITGHVVFQSAETMEVAGIHSITFNEKQLAAGIYAMQFKAGDEVKIIKMVIEK
ncbi:MAG: T9SS type A sorting domain-containing protein [Chitinophagales bacterium]